jgi:general secretion pathway protein I
MAPSRRRAEAGFTLLEVLVAFAILSIAIVSLIELCSQGLRLLKLSGDHQQAVQLADRIARETEVSGDSATAETLDGGEEGNFAWERRVARLELPPEFEPKQTVPGRELPGLYTVSVSVRWGRNQSVEVATLRAPSPTSATTQTFPEDAPQGDTPGTPGAPGTPGTPGTGRTPAQGAQGGAGSGSGSSGGTSRTPGTRSTR